MPKYDQINSSIAWRKESKSLLGQIILLTFFYFLWTVSFSRLLLANSQRSLKQLRMWNWIFCIFRGWVYTIAECRMFCLHGAKHLEWMKNQLNGLDVRLVSCFRVSFSPSGCETPFDISSRSQQKINCLHTEEEKKPHSVFPRTVFLSILLPKLSQGLQGSSQVTAPDPSATGKSGAPVVCHHSVPFQVYCPDALLSGSLFILLVSQEEKQRQLQPISEPHVTQSNIMSCLLLRALQVPQIFLKCDCL